MSTAYEVRTPTGRTLARSLDYDQINDDARHYRALDLDTAIVTVRLVPGQGWVATQ